MNTNNSKTASLPAHVVSVLGCPKTNEPLDVFANWLQVRGGDRRYFISDGIINLSLYTDIQLADIAATWPARPTKYEFLHPTQVRFRKLLRRFQSRLQQDAIVVDIACGAGDFRDVFEDQCYIGMDFSVDLLRSALRSSRISFAVLADVRRPPLRCGSTDVIVSTNTVNHLPSQDVPGVVRKLVSFIKPGGYLVMTINARHLNQVQQESNVSVIETNGLGGLGTAIWGRFLGRLIKWGDRSQIMRFVPWRRINGIAAEVLSFVDTLCYRFFPRWFDFLWVVIRVGESTTSIRPTAATPG